MASHVRVVLRVRPFLPSETKCSVPMPCITLVDEEKHAGGEVTVHLKDQWSSRNECYKLDSFFGQDDHVDQIFDREVRAVIPGIFRGFNATVFAYGATGSGKTYTMQGTEGGPGLIPLAISAILAACEDSQSSVEISYYEIYMDRCYDLLEPKAKEIMALDDMEGHVQLKGLSWIPVRSMDEFCEVYSIGVQRRKVAHTSLNDVSSRSHAVLAIAVTNGAVKGKLNLIDLAGNEDNRQTCNEGIRLQESAKINQSLFALSNVIYALNNNDPRIPYRDSKLTRILQDSLGGTNHALMIACLNPTSYQEAVRTVSLAARSRHIVNYVGSASKKDTPIVEVDMEAKLRAWLQSKGKTKSIQRMNGLCSPLMGKTLTSVTDLKRSISICTSEKEKAIDRDLSNPKGRKLFDSGVKFSHTKENTNASKEDCHGTSAMLDYQSPPCKDETSEDYTNDQLERPTITPFFVRTLDNDKDGRGGANFSKTNNRPGTPSDKENLHHSTDIDRSLPTSEKLHELPSSFRKVFSLIPNNVAPTEQPLSEDRIHTSLLEPKTPKTPYENDKVQLCGTPLDKFNMLSSNLKKSVIQEYLSFLNVATKEELLQVKGIGPKRAEWILHLREETPKPLRSLSDLEKIGLSSKQVHDMFRRGTRGILS